MSDVADDDRERIARLGHFKQLGKVAKLLGSFTTMAVSVIEPATVN
jgi:hypothetical protein